MSDQDNLHENSTLKMETDFDKIFNAIGEMRQDFTNRFDKLESEQIEIKKKVDKIERKVDEMERKVDKIEIEQIEMKQFMDVQFEAIRQGLVKNYNQYNQLISEISQNRSAIFSTKAAVGELQESVYLLTKNVHQPI